MPRRLAIAFALVLSLIVAPTATARIEGPCTARIHGEDVSSRETDALSDAIPVDRDNLVSVTMSSTRPIQRLKVEIEFSGLRWTVHDRPNSGTSWASEVPVDDYAVYGIGLYKVVGSSFGQGFTCEAAALIDVQGDESLDPLVTVAGLVGFGLALMGALGMLATRRASGAHARGRSSASCSASSSASGSWRCSSSSRFSTRPQPSPSACSPPAPRWGSRSASSGCRAARATPRAEEDARATRRPRG